MPNAYFFYTNFHKTYLSTTAHKTHHQIRTNLCGRFRQQEFATNWKQNDENNLHKKCSIQQNLFWWLLNIFECDNNFDFYTIIQLFDPITKKAVRKSYPPRSKAPPSVPLCKELNTYNPATHIEYDMRIHIDESQLKHFLIFIDH